MIPLILRGTRETQHREELNPISAKGATVRNICSLNQLPEAESKLELASFTSNHDEHKHDKYQWYWLPSPPESHLIPPWWGRV
jgi:hypothetical protein